MTIMQLTLGVLLLLFSVLIIIVVLLQEGHQQNISAVMGNTDTFYSRNKSRSIDAFLERWTKFIAIGFFILVIAINAVLFFVK